MFMAAAANGEKRGGAGQEKSKGRGGGVASHPADRRVLSFQRSPLSLLFTSIKECRAGVKKRAGRNNEARSGGDEREEERR